MSAIRGERGQTLVMVLVFVVAFSLVLTAALGFAATSSSANRVTTAVGRQLEAADAGIEFGIQKVKAAVAALFASVASTEPLPVSVNAQTVSVVVTQLDLRSLAVSGPATLALSATGDYQAVLGGPAFSAAKSAAGTPLAAGTYNVRVTALTAAGESAGSFQQQIVLAAGDRIDVTVTNRADDAQYAVYIALDPAAETRQALVTKATGATTTYQQTAALTTGPALPAALAFPFGVTWAVLAIDCAGATSTASGITAQQLDDFRVSGRFMSSLVGRYQLAATLGNVSATKVVAVGGATCP